MANYTAARLGMSSQEHYKRMHHILKRNYDGFKLREVPLDSFLSAIAKDKKNVGKKLSLILPNHEGCVARVQISNNESFQKICSDFLMQESLL